MHSVELFSGCGALALGTAKAGFEHVFMVERNKDACATLYLNKQNNTQHARDWRIYEGDVCSVDWSALGDQIELVAGGPPCQPFSIGGKHGGENDNRDMWPQAVRAVADLRPKAFLFENVRGLARPAFAHYLDWIVECLRNPVDSQGQTGYRPQLVSNRRRPALAQYTVSVFKVNAADFGAAQKRHRIVITGLRSAGTIELSGPQPTHTRERLIWDKWITGEYWHRHGMHKPKIVPASEMAIISRLKKANTAPNTNAWVTVRDALSDLGLPNGLNAHCFQDGARAYPGHTGSLLDEPAKALKAGDHGVPGGENMMVMDNGLIRYFTVREAARLQGLPDSWQIAGSWSESMRQLGNAVPVPLGFAMARWLVHEIQTAKIPAKVA